jgi:hypothetical protein
LVACDFSSGTSLNLYINIHAGKKMASLIFRHADLQPWSLWISPGSAGRLTGIQRRRRFALVLPACSS